MGKFTVVYWANLLKKLLINFLDVQRLFDNATDAMKNHQSGELVPVHEDNSLAQLLGRLALRRCEGRSANEQALRRFESVKTATKVADITSADGVHAA